MTTINYSSGQSFSTTIITPTIIGVPAELIDIPETSSSVRVFVNRWNAEIEKIAEAMKPMMNKLARKFAYDIFVKHTKAFKAKTIHKNSGSMRKRKTRYCFTRANKQIVIKETLFNNAYQISFKEDINEKASGE